jgi:UDP-glucose 4-epimerase
MQRVRPAREPLTSRRRVLVTGASGFVGANLARRLLHDGHEVHVILRPSHQRWRVDEIRDEVKIHAVDLDEDEGLERAFASARPDWIFHLAAYGAYPEQRDFERMVTTNLQGLARLLASAERAGFEAFVNAGTSSEYGYKDHAPSESEMLEPNSHYAVSKAAATHLCLMTARRTGLPIRTLRLYSAYGPYEEPSRLVPTLIVKGLDGRLPPLADPNIARDYVHVDDVCEAFVLAAATRQQEPGVVYNVGTGVQTTLAEIVEVTRRLLNIVEEPSWGSMAKRGWDTNVWVSDPALIDRRLRWKAMQSLEAGLAQTLEWFRSHPDLTAHYRSVLSTPVRN